MIDRSHDLPITKQAKVLNVSRGSVYYLPRPPSTADLALMRRMDELHLDFPFAGSRMLRDLMTAEGFQVGRRHVATLMKRMGIQAVYRKPNTSKPTPGHKIYPYLLRDLSVTRPNQVWAMDIQHRSGQPVHQHGVHRPADRQRHRHQHGRPRRLAGQCVRGATLAIRQV